MLHWQRVFQLQQWNKQKLLVFGWFVFLLWKKRLVVKVQLSIPIDELSTLHPNCRSLRQVRCLTSITSVNYRNSSHIFDAKFFVSHKVEARNNHQTRTAKLPEPKELAGWTAGHSNLRNFWQISKSILSNPSLILSSWAHSPGPSCSFTSASSFW